MSNTNYYTWAPHFHYKPLVWHRGGEVFPVTPQFGVAEDLAREAAGGEEVNIKKVIIREPKNPGLFKAGYGALYSEELLREPIREAKRDGVDLLNTRYVLDNQGEDINLSIVIDPALRVTYTQVTPIYLTQALVDRLVGGSQFSYWYGVKFYHRARWDEVADALLRDPPREWPIAIWSSLPHLNTGDTWEARLALCRTEEDRAWLACSCPNLGGNDTWVERFALQRDVFDRERLAGHCPQLGQGDTQEVRDAMIEDAYRTRYDRSIVKKMGQPYRPYIRPVGEK